MLYENTEISQVKDKGQLDSLAEVLELLSAKFDELQKKPGEERSKNF